MRLGDDVMNDQGDYKDLMKQKHFLGEVEQAIKNKRELFEETRMAFDDLKDCIEKGYIDIEELD